MHQIIALFGEAEKGEVSSLIFVKSLIHLNDLLGHPTDDSLGIFFAIQSLLYKQEVIFIRVKEEGFSTKDYLRGMQQLLNKKKVPRLTAIFLPGVGDTHIIDAATTVIKAHAAVIIMTERDLYDYLTSLPPSKNLGDQAMS